VRSARSHSTDRSKGGEGLKPQKDDAERMKERGRETGFFAFIISLKPSNA